MTTKINITVLIVLALASAARAVQVQDLVRIKGSEKNTLVGMGLVVGLNGTGDGGKFLPAMRPLASVIQKLIDPNVVASELKDAKNVALVTLTATLPSSGVREGDRVDVRVAAVGPAKSLQGGQLFLIPMTGPVPNSPVYAFAEGPVTVEDPAVPTVGVVKDGAQLTRDVMARYMDANGRLTLVINNAFAGWPMSNNLAALINGIMAPDGPNIAKAIDQKNVVIDVPQSDRSDPAAFISQILQSYVDPALVANGAKVVINEKTGSIVISGDVQMSPVLISYEGLTITTLNPPVPPTAANPQLQTKHFIALDPDNRGGARLADLLNAFNQLKVKAADRIAIIKEIHKSGKLYAQLVME